MEFFGETVFAPDQYYHKEVRRGMGRLLAGLPRQYTATTRRPFRQQVWQHQGTYYQAVEFYAFRVKRPLGFIPVEFEYEEPEVILLRQTFGDNDGPGQKQIYRYIDETLQVAGPVPPDACYELGMDPESPILQEAIANGTSTPREEDYDAFLACVRTYIPRRAAWPVR